MNSSVESFNANRDAIMRRHPAHRVPSYDQMKRQISSITGVGSVIHAMCKNSCLAFTGPFADLDHCPKCGEPKFCPGTKKFQQEFHTILLGPGFTSSVARCIKCKKLLLPTTENLRGSFASFKQTLAISPLTMNFFSGSDYLENVRSGKIRDNDIILMLSIDGAQLYAHKSSDCWIYLWVIMDFSPDNRYKKHHVLPVGLSQVE